MKVFQGRQGDVLITRISAPKTNIRKKVEFKGNKLILAYGETTGHHHALVVAEPEQKEKNELPQLWELEDDKYYLTIPKEIELEHITEDLQPTGDHDKFLLPQGDYEVIIQRNLNLQGEIKRVVD